MKWKFEIDASKQQQIIFYYAKQAFNRHLRCEQQVSVAMFIVVQSFTFATSVVIIGLMTAVR